LSTTPANVTATENSAGTAAALPVYRNNVFVPTIDFAANGVILPAANQGEVGGPGSYGHGPQKLTVFSISDSKAPLKVYPASGDNAPAIDTIQPGFGVVYTAISQGNWNSTPL
jgi:hypothetical protein